MITVCYCLTVNKHIYGYWELHLILTINWTYAVSIFGCFLPFPYFSPPAPLPTSSFLLALWDSIFCWIAEMWSTFSPSSSLFFCPPLLVTCSYYRFNLSVQILKGDVTSLIENYFIISIAWSIVNISTRVSGLKQQIGYCH